MSQLRSPIVTRWFAWGLTIAVLAAAVLPFGPYIARRLEHVTLDGPDWALWAALDGVVKLHIGAAFAALAIGTIILFRPKGRGLHKILGWSWVVAMATTAVSSLFMTGLNGDAMSLVHLLSGWTIVALPMGIFAIRNRKVDSHRRTMTGLFVGGLLVAGGLTFLPGRFMFEFFLN